MKFLTRKMIVARKILIILLVALMLIFAITPNYSVQAVEVITQEDMPDEGGSIMGSLLKQIIQIIAAIGDIAMGVLNYFMLGADGFTSAMLPVSNNNINNPASWLYVDDDEEIDFQYEDGTIDTSEFFVWTGDTFDIPNFLYSPEAIFSNNIAALDVNFLNPNTYDAVSSEPHAQDASDSAAAGSIRQAVSDWYVSFRNIAIVGLLSVLVYLGIRILISSTATDKAKYKESLQNWVVALCLVFFIHFIMAGLLMITDRFTDLFSDAANSGITVQINSTSEGMIKFRTNLIGFARFNAQSVSMYNTAAYTILYIALVIYTFVFTFMYFKRFLYMAFFTMIAPLVALTYPIDKAGDGKAQAFNLWFKEYTMNLILQPVHLILYVALVSSAMDLVKQNLLYALVAIAFLIPAEKFIKKMFGMDKAESPSGFGSFAAGAATMSGLKQVASMIGGGKNKKSSGGSDRNSSDTENSTNNRIRTQERGFLSSYRNGNNGDNGDNEAGSQAQLNEGNDNSIDFANESENGNGLQQEENLQGQQQNGIFENYEANENHSGIHLPSTFDADRQWEAARAEQNEEETQNGQQTALNAQRQAGNVTPTGQQQNSQARASQENMFPIRREDYGRRRRIRAAKKVGKIAYKGAKIAAQVAGTAGGAMVGLAAGLTTGDFSNALTFMGAGALAGRQIGKGLGTLSDRGVDLAYGARDAIENKREEYQYNKDKDMFGVSYAAEQAAARQNERAKKRFLDDKKEEEKYEEMAGRIRRSTGRNVETKDLMEAAFDYKKAGITDEKQIENGLTLEAQTNGGVNGDKHESMIDVINMANSYGKDYVLDEKKRKTMHGLIKDAVGQNNIQEQNEVWDFYTKALGINEKTADRYAINPRTQPTQTQPRRPQQQQRTQTQPRRPQQRPPQQGQGPQ